MRPCPIIEFQTIKYIKRKEQIYDKEKERLQTIEDGQYM